jgi:signal transduction histidine kinase
VQEALTNVLKHARAQRLSVLLDCRRDHVLAIVEDDGIGCDLDTLLRVSQKQGRLGVVGMQERAALVRGTVEFESTPGAGTTVFIRLPFLPTDDAHGSTGPSAPTPHLSGR